MILVSSITKDGESFQVLSPGVGIFSSSLFPGTFLTEEHPLGTLKILNRNYDIYLPRGTFGVVETRKPSGMAVEYKAPLVRLTEKMAPSSGSQQTEEKDSPHDLWEIPALMDGIFYRQPKPGSPSFVEVGSKIKKGDTLGLLEVMKTFYPMLYEGPGLPDQAEVVEILVEDGGEVKGGQALVRIKR